MSDTCLPNSINLNFRIPTVIGFIHESGVENQGMAFGRPGSKDTASSRIQIGTSTLM